MYVQFCSEAKRCPYWLVNETMVRDRDILFSARDEIETETFPRFHETETFGNYVSRPSRDRDVETETTSLAQSATQLYEKSPLKGVQ